MAFRGTLACERNKMAICKCLKQNKTVLIILIHLVIFGLIYRLESVQLTRLVYVNNANVVNLSDEATKKESINLYKIHHSTESSSLTRKTERSNKRPSNMFRSRNSNILKNQLLKESDLNTAYKKRDFKVASLRKYNVSGNNAFKVLNYKIGVLIPSTTRTINHPDLKHLSLINMCLPSIFKFMERNYQYHIYIGVDKGDYLETVKNKLETMFDNLTVIVTDGATFTMAVNAIARVAFKDGVDYFVRINDDTSFETSKWASKGIKALQTLMPPNVGVSGPTFKEGNQRILTHDMVHRTHLEIFGHYYPPQFDNWFTDGWITRVYQPGRSVKIGTWIVKHHLTAHNTRYKVDVSKRPLLYKTIAIDKKRLSRYLSNL